MKSLKNVVNENLQINESKNASYNYKFKVNGEKGDFEVLTIFPVMVNGVENKVAIVDSKSKDLWLCEIVTGTILTRNAKNNKKFVDTYFKEDVNKITLKALVMGGERINNYFDLFLSFQYEAPKTFTMFNGGEVDVVDSFDYMGIKLLIVKQNGYAVVSEAIAKFVGIKGMNKTKLKKEAIEFLDKQSEKIGFDKLKEILTKK